MGSVEGVARSLEVRELAPRRAERRLVGAAQALDLLGLAPAG